MKKMSRSIKDYKDAMDSIRISESFYKRTETLLNELPEEEIEKRPFYMSRKITAGIMAAAACVICVIGIRAVIDIRNDNIASISETGLTEIEKETTEVSVPELIDLPEHDPIDDMLAEGTGIDASADESEEEALSVPNVGVNGENPAAAAPDDPAAVTTEAAEKGGTANSTPAENGSSGNTLTTGGTESGGNGTSAAQRVTMLDDVAYEKVTFEITPYFDMDDIVSGESAVKLNGTECRELTEYIRELSEKAYILPNASFKSLFSISIADENAGTTFYSIYVTDQNTMVITKHDRDGQKRVSYGLSVSASRELKRMLFIMFGEESDYELFENLVSGK